MTEPVDRLEEKVRFLGRLLEEEADAEVADFLDGLHPSDLADIVEGLEGEEARKRVLGALSPELAAGTLAELDPEAGPERLLVGLEPERVARVVEALPDDDAADLIGRLDAREQARLLGSLDDASRIRELLHYPEDTAGGIMTRDLMAVPGTSTAGEALDEIRRRATELDDFYTIFVVAADGRLEGVVSLPGLVLADPSRPLTELVEEPPAVVPVEMDQEDVGRILSKYNLAAIGVVDPRGRLVGRITFDDVIDVMEAEVTEDILRFAAVSEEEAIRGTTRDAVRSRLPWLVVNLGTAVMAASVVYFFQETIERIILLAAVMPIIAGMGGNAGTQALAVTVRRIALADESLAERWQVVGKELLVGLVNGLTIGLIIAAAGLLLVGQVRFGLVVMLAMWGNLVVASSVGAFVPILLESIGVDPAVASSIFVTTFTDLCGFFFLLGLASVVLL